MESINATIKNIKYTKENFAVVECTADKDYLSKNGIAAGLLTCCGRFINPAIGDNVTLQGSITNSKYGRQFSVASCTVNSHADITDSETEKEEELTIKGEIVKILFQKENFSIVNCTVEDMNLLWERELFGGLVCSGNIPNPKEGTKLLFTGKFTNHPKYGTQFAVAYCELDITDKSSITDYLMQYVKGVGKAMAKRIVELFGEETLEVFRKEPERLLEVKGITQKKLKGIVDSFNETQCFFRIAKLFHGAATPTQVGKIYEKYGDKAEEKITENPYCVIYDIEGIGFAIADKLAMSMGIAKSDTRRVKAAICYTLISQQNEGHTFCDADTLYESAKSLTDLDVSKETFFECVASEVQAKNVVVEDENIYHRDLHFAEVNVAEKIKRLIESEQPQYSQHKLDKQLAEEEFIEHITFEVAQREAIQKSLNNRVSVITGGAGTGKSTIIKQIVKAYHPENVIMLAPTGRAAKRMSETANYICLGQTIHKFIYSTGDEVKGKHFIVDESSMIDLALANLLLTKVALSSTIVFLGDVNQLPPIGAGMFFRDLINSGIVPCTKLTTSHRFGGLIAHNANLINQGGSIYSLQQGEDFKFLETEDEELEQVIVREYRELLKTYKVEDIQLIVPTRKKGTVCTDTMNEVLRQFGNPKFTPADTDRDSFTRFQVGDRVINTVNISDSNGEPICNGDCGFINEIDEDNKLIYVTMDDNRTVRFDNQQILQLAYAVTAHKSQGSQYKAVIVVQSMQHYIMLQRNLIYTAITRAKQKLILIGTSKAVSLAVRNVRPIKRRSKLLERLK